MRKGGGGQHPDVVGVEEALCQLEAFETKVSVEAAVELVVARVGGLQSLQLLLYRPIRHLRWVGGVWIRVEKVRLVKIRID